MGFIKVSTINSPPALPLSAYAGLFCYFFKKLDTPPPFCDTRLEGMPRDRGAVRATQFGGAEGVLHGEDF